MTKNGKNGQKTGQDKCLCPVKDFSELGTNKWGQDIITWLITEKAHDDRYAPGTAYNVRRLMVRTNVLHPTAADVPRMQAWIMQSDFSKSHKRHLLRSLELYLEFLDIRNEEGKFFKFRKPNANRKLPTYLTQDEMRALVMESALYFHKAIRLNTGDLGLKFKSDWHITFNEFCEGYKIFKNGKKKRNYANHSRLQVAHKAGHVIIEIEQRTRFSSGDKYDQATYIMDLKQLDELTSFLCQVRMDLAKIEADPDLKDAVTKGYAGPPETVWYFGRKPKDFDTPLRSPRKKIE